MIGSILQYEDLQQLCQPGKRPRLATVEAWARRQGIRFQYDGAGGIWTTLEALNAALGMGTASSNESRYSAEELF